MFKNGVGSCIQSGKQGKKAELFQEANNFYKVEPQHWRGGERDSVSICSCYPFMNETNPRWKTNEGKLEHGE